MDDPSIPADALAPQLTGLPQPIAEAASRLDPAPRWCASGVVLPENFLLSVVMPVFNEAGTIAEILARVRNCGIPCEIIVIDDGSTDGTPDVLRQWREQSGVKILSQEKNLGKGAALKTGFLATAGDVVIVQDADLEYDPADYARLIQPIVARSADVVFGSRFQAGRPPGVRFWHFWGNYFITQLSNQFTRLKLTDIETCYKVFRGPIIRRIAPTLKEQRFGIEPELTAKLARLPEIRVIEQPIHYTARTHDQGKKIGWRDGFRALYCIVRYSVCD